MLAVALVGAAVYLAVGRDDEPDAGFDSAATGCDPELDRGLRAWADAGFSGSVAVSTGGDFDCVSGYGLADQAAGTKNTADTVFSIGSISKAFTAAAVLRLADDGALSLAQPVGQLVTDLSGPVSEASVESLLVHTSGLTGTLGQDYEPIGRDSAVEGIGELKVASEPGSEFLYSNAGYTLLALIIEEVSGTNFRDYVATQVLSLPEGEAAGGFWDGEPAADGPRAVGYLDGGGTGEPGDFEGPYWATDGNGSLAMTTQDLAAWTNALFTDEVLSQESLDLLLEPGFPGSGGGSEVPGWVLLDDSRLGQPALVATGGGGDVGHDAAAVWLPETQRAIAIASNTPSIRAEDLLAAVGPALAAGEPLPEPMIPTDGIDPAERARIEGSYRLETGGSLEVAAAGGALTIEARDADAVALLLPLPAESGLRPEDATAHERSVLSLMAGETQEGRKELRLLESDLGPIDNAALAGTIVDDGELRTYVEITSDGNSITAWYALDRRGGISGVQLEPSPPTLQLASVRPGRYRPIDPLGGAPDVTVEFEDGRMKVIGPGTTTTAQLNPESSNLP